MSLLLDDNTWIASLDLPVSPPPTLQDHDDVAVKPLIPPGALFIMHGSRLDAMPGFMDVVQHAAADAEVTWLAAGDRRLKLGTFAQLGAAAHKHQYLTNMHADDSAPISHRLERIKAEMVSTDTDEKRPVYVFMLIRTPTYVKGQLAKTQLGENLARSIIAWTVDNLCEFHAWIDDADVIHAAKTVDGVALHIHDMVGGVGALQDMIGVREIAHAAAVQITVTPTHGASLLAATIEDPEGFYTESSAFKMQSTARKNSDGQLIFSVPNQQYNTSNCRRLVLIGVGAVAAFTMHGEEDEEARTEPFKITVGSSPVPSEHLPWLVRDGEMLDDSEGFIMHSVHMLSEPDGLRALGRSQEGRLVRTNLIAALSGSVAAAAFDTSVGGDYLARTASTAFGGGYTPAYEAAAALLKRS
jgi:hypothetical protein